jgi:quercetin dioxygenase-like cupin family protein
MSIFAAFFNKMIMKKIMNWVLAATLVCGASVFTSCKQAKPQEANDEQTVSTEVQKVTTEELIRTSQSWDGVELPDYFQGRPELVAVKYVFPAGQKLGWHHHPVMNYGVLVQGELTIIGQDGKEKVVHEGEAVVEMVNTIHHGENRGTKPVILYMFYLSQKDLPLAVQHPEIPLE